MPHATPSFSNPKLAAIVQEMATAFAQAGGRAFLVGGAVRDAQLGVPSGDADFEVYGLQAEQLETVCESFGPVHLVGKQFAVLHVATELGQVEVSMPRTESKTGPGHKGFAVSADPQLDFSLAAARRDFTVNALMFDPLSGELLDPWNGIADIKAGILRHVSEAFSEDPLRVLRAARFSARFAWKLAPETTALCRNIDLTELPSERVAAELKNILLKGIKPGYGFKVLRDVGALSLLPEVGAMQGVPQDPVWHPEGDVFHHTCLCLDAAVAVRDEMADPWVEMLGVLCHDLGKATCTKFERGRWRSLEHDTRGAHLSRDLIARFSRQEDVQTKVAALVREHLRPTQLFFADNVGESAIRRLAVRVDIPSLVRVAWADAAGRLDLDFTSLQDWEPGQWLIERATELGVKDSAPGPFLLGRDLLNLGMSPGREIGAILDEAFELQLDGELADKEQALEWLTSRIKQ